MNNEQDPSRDFHAMLDATRRELLDSPPSPDLGLQARFGGTLPLAANDSTRPILVVTPDKSPAVKQPRSWLVAAAVVLIAALGATALFANQRGGTTSIVAAASTSDTSGDPQSPSNSGSTADPADPGSNNNRGVVGATNGEPDDENRSDGTEPGDHRGVPDFDALVESFTDSDHPLSDACEFSSDDTSFRATCRWPECHDDSGTTCGLPPGFNFDSEVPGGFIFGFDLQVPEGFRSENFDSENFDFGDFDFQPFGLESFDFEGFNLDDFGFENFEGFGFGGFDFDPEDFEGFSFDPESFEGFNFGNFDFDPEDFEGFDLESFGLRGPLSELFGTDGELSTDSGS